MTLPSGSQWEADEPAFETIKAFQQCDRFIAYRGEEVSAGICDWGNLRLDSDEGIEMFDLLFSHEALCHPLSPGTYSVQTLIEDSNSTSSARDTYFSMISHSTILPDRWKQIERYGADGNNMAISPAQQGQRFRAFREEFEASLVEEHMYRWNLLTDLAISFSEEAASMISAANIQVAAPGRDGTLVVMRTSKIANLFVGYHDETPVAIQGRWL